MTDEAMRSLYHASARVKRVEQFLWSRSEERELSHVSPKSLPNTVKHQPEFYSVKHRHPARYMLIHTQINQREAFDEWLRMAESTGIDLLLSSDPSLRAYVTPAPNSAARKFEHQLQKIEKSVRSYREDVDGIEGAAAISEESIKRLLQISFVLIDYNFHVHFDAQNGFAHVDIHAPDNGVLLAQILPNGKINYSLVTELNRIVKFTGTAKFRCPQDYIGFSKVLAML